MIEITCDWCGLCIESSLVVKVYLADFEKDFLGTDLSDLHTSCEKEVNAKLEAMMNEAAQ